jgi:hypothetical protein
MEINPAKPPTTDMERKSSATFPCSSNVLEEIPRVFLGKPYALSV